LNILNAEACLQRFIALIRLSIFVLKSGTGTGALAKENKYCLGWKK